MTSFLTGIGLGALGASLVGWWLVRRLRASLASLSGTMAAHSHTIRQQIEELTTERNQLTAILDGMAEGVVAIDQQGRILLMNPSAQRLLGLPAPGRGAGVFEVIRHPDIHALVRDLLQTHQRLMKEFRLFQPTERMLRVNGVPCEGPGQAVVLVIQDVTESFQYEQLRKEFVANVSHELRSPLTSIRSFTETLLGGAIDDPTSNRRFVQLLDDDAARLSRLIDDLLALSQIESQAVPLALSTIALESLVTSVVASLRPGIAQRRLAVTVELPPDLTVKADADRLRQVLANLLDNAIKYNKERGTITVSATRDNAWAKVTVADTGIGIPEQDLPRIFERFYRVDKARSRELGGTGLGLSIVKHIVEAHGGRVSVESQFDRGSTFSFTIPLAS